jgi:hypothetical protein
MVNVSGKNNPMFGKHHSDETREKNTENETWKICWKEQSNVW